MTEKQAITRIATYCSKAERCRYDVRRKLDLWKFDNETIGRIITRMEKENFLNEERFCQSFIKDKLRFNKWGKTKIVFELRKKQISDSIVSSSFEALAGECDFETPLLKILETKIKSIKAKSDFEKRVKLFRFAAGRGYAPDLINKCLDKLLGGGMDEEYPL